jgi:chemotaxis protein methyltransferase CheR
MSDRECIEFLRHWLPRIGLSWKGFRKPRSQVCKRIASRTRELGLEDLNEYSIFLASNKDEIQTLDVLCRVTISRFYRDKQVFDTLGTDILPSLARSAMSNGKVELRCWSAGCASGEEPYTVNIIWRLLVEPALPGPLSFSITATDSDPAMLERARKGIYKRSCISELPEEMLHRAFMPDREGFILKQEFKEGVDFLQMDIRDDNPEGMFDLILCRNLAFTYYGPEFRLKILDMISNKLSINGLLIIGSHESLPEKKEIFVRSEHSRSVYRKVI